MQVNRASPVPMWHQIELALAQDIQTGVLLPGAKLPAEADVAARFGVHRHTARRALATLAEKGALRIQRGLGTFVEDTVIQYPISERTRFTANLHQQNRLASHDLLESNDQPRRGPDRRRAGGAAGNGSHAVADPGSGRRDPYQPCIELFSRRTLSRPR